MAKQKPKPHTLWFAHDDGRWLEVVLESYEQLHHPGMPEGHPGGLYLGSDPSCDVVLDGDDVEAFHAIYYARGHHTFVEAISGRMPTGSSDDLLYPGDVARGGFSIGGWRLSYPAHLEEPIQDPALRAAFEVAHDARLEGRTAEAAEILAQVGHARVEVARRTEIPAALVWAAQVLRIRVEDRAGATEVHAIGSIERLRGGVTIGSDPACDLVLEAAGRNRITLVRKQQLWVEVHAGVVAEAGPSWRRREHRESFKLHSLWTRLELGDAIVQLCRWPGRREPLR